MSSNRKVSGENEGRAERHHDNRFVSIVLPLFPIVKMAPPARESEANDLFEYTKAILKLELLSFHLKSKPPVRFLHDKIRTQQGQNLAA